MKSELFQTIEVYNKAIVYIKLRPGPVLPLVGQFEYTRTPLISGHCVQTWRHHKPEVRNISVGGVAQW